MKAKRATVKKAMEAQGRRIQDLQQAEAERRALDPEVESETDFKERLQAMLDEEWSIYHRLSDMWVRGDE